VKLFNSLYNSRYVIINENITDDPELISLCLFGSAKDKIRQQIITAAEKDYDSFENRKNILEKSIRILLKPKRWLLLFSEINPVYHFLNIKLSRHAQSPL
jgi:hypothetical protein